MITYDDLFHSFGSAGLLVGPSELHGLYCGRLVLGEVLSNQELTRVSGLYADREDLEDVEAELVDLYQLCMSQLKGDGFEFQILLPDDETPIGQRTQALAEWCQGFLFGISDAGLGETSALSEETVETLTDLTAIAQLRPEDADTEDEMNFFELVEFVRVVVAVMYAELNQSKPSSQPTLH